MQQGSFFCVHAARVHCFHTRVITRAMCVRVCGGGSAANGISIGHFLTGPHCKLRPNTKGKNDEFVVRESASTPEAHIVVVKEGTEARCAFSTEVYSCH